MKKEVIKPKALQRGDTIGIAAPAAILSQKWIEQAKIALNKQGFGCKVASNAKSSHGYHAGKDEERAQAFMDLWLDPDIDVIWCARGGFGSGKLLPYLDFEQIKKHPKMLIGMSDITALHIALGQEASLVSYLGPNLSHFFQIDNPSTDFTYHYCWDFLKNPSFIYEYKYPEIKNIPIKIVKEGIGEGPLVGGNLSLITSLIGTPWQLKTSNTLLVLEDVNEAPYRIDRMLNQLQLSGMLDDLKGVILGTFDKCISSEPERSLDLNVIFKEYFGDRAYPVLWGFPTGHVADQVTLPLQCLAKLDTYTCLVSLLESPVSDGIVTSID